MTPPRDTNFPTTDPKTNEGLHISKDLNLIITRSFSELQRNNRWTMQQNFVKTHEQTQKLNRNGKSKKEENKATTLNIMNEIK